MKEEDIRPEQLVRESVPLHAEDLRKLFENKSRFVEVPCPACEATRHRFEFDKDGFTFVTCMDCETLFINPRPTAAMLNEFYALSRCVKYRNEKIFPATEGPRRAEIFAPRAARVVELCRTHGVETRTLLDVGAGYGTFCEEVKKLHVFDSVVALEPSPDYAETCRRKGIEVIEKPIEDAGVSGVDVLTNFELIEHLYAPGDFLASCRQALAQGGLMILTTPNVKGFDLQVLGRLSDNMCGPYHLNYFHPDSLGRLLRRRGFEVMEALTPGKLDAELVRKKILSGAFDASKEPFLRSVLVDHWETAGRAFQDFLAESGLSSHLWIVARKVS